MPNKHIGHCPDLACSSKTITAKVDMKFLRAVLCLLVSAAPLCLGDIITSGVSESWREVLESLLLYCGLVGIVWLLVFLPLLFFTRRFETWGCWKGGLLGSVLVWALFLVLWWLMKPQGSAAETATWFVDCLILGLCTGLLFALGSLISTERWAHKLGLVLLLWRSAIHRRNKTGINCGNGWRS